MITKSNYSFSSLHGVGITLPGAYTKLDNIDENGEGEICMSGRHIFMGYLNEPEKTAEAKDKDGWMHSGDVGKLDSNGSLSITGIYFSFSASLTPTHSFSIVMFIKTNQKNIYLVVY